MRKMTFLRDLRGMEDLSIQCRNDMGTFVFTGGNVPGIGQPRTPKQSSNEQGDAGNEDR